MIAFIDTESHPHTKEPLSVQIRYNNNTFVFKNFDDDDFKSIKQIWNEAEAVVIFNAPYDMGALASCFDNEFKWEEGKLSSYWRMRLFDNDYKVRRISSHRNFIKSLNKFYGREHTQLLKGVPKYNTKIPKQHSTPIIDLLKLWSILVEDGSNKDKNGKIESIGLKAIVKREFDYDMLHWSEENALLEKYITDDVIYLEKLWYRFLDKVKNVSEIEDFTLEDWAFIKTPATFTKLLYQKEYPELKESQKANDVRIDQYNLKNGFEKAYHGGITLSFYRGSINNVLWIDIVGAYAKAIEVLNTDNYIEFDIEEVSEFDMQSPYLLYIDSNFIMESINKSLKLYYVSKPRGVWIWNYDIDAINNLIDDYQYTVKKIYKIIPLMDVKPLPIEWQSKKDSLDKNNPDERVLREFYKFLSNTSYGIKAQRKPFITIHTNMAIAGMITAKVHQVLCKIIKTGRDNGLINLYNDTDSAAFHFIDLDIRIIDKINNKIKPFQVNTEGIFKDNIFLSLKRYVSTNDISNEYSLKREDDKVKIHGKGRYDVSRDEILEFIKTQTVTDKAECLLYGSMAANTKRTLNMILNLDGKREIISNPHPFMFVKDVLTDRTREEFYISWYDHIDTKLSDPKDNARTFRTFGDGFDAALFFGAYNCNDAEALNMARREWDKEISEDFN